MTLAELYNTVGSYAAVKDQLGNDDTINRCIRAFLREPAYDRLMEAWKNGNAVSIFSWTQILNRSCQQLGLTRLGYVTSAIAETYRGSFIEKLDAPTVDMLFASFDRTYKETTELLNEYLHAAEQEKTRRRPGRPRKVAVA